MRSAFGGTFRSQLVKQDIFQVIERFPKLQGIDQGLAVSVVDIQPVQVFAFNQKADNPAVILIKPHLYQTPATAQIKGSTEQIRRLHCAPHPFITSSRRVEVLTKADPARHRGLPRRRVCLWPRFIGVDF
jgi:hypothetical protein